MIVGHVHTAIESSLWVHLMAPSDDISIVHTDPQTSVSLTLPADIARWLGTTLLAATPADLPPIQGE